MGDRARGRRESAAPSPSRGTRRSRRSARRRCRRSRATARRSAATSTPSRGAATSVSAPFSSTTAPKRDAARRTAASRCASTSPRLDAEQPRQLAGVRRQDGRRGALERLELPERVGVEHDRQLEPLEQDADELARAVAAAEARARSRPHPRARPPRATASAARGSSRPAESSGSGRLTASSSRASITGSVDSGTATVDVARRRRGTPRARRASARRSARASRRRRAPSRRGTSCSRVVLRGTSREHASRGRARARARATASPIGATCTEPAWKRPGAIASPTFGGAERDGDASARTAAPGTSPVDAFDARGHVDRDDRLARGVDPLDHPRDVLARRLREADPEQRVDDHVRLAELAERPRRPSPRGPRSRSTRAQTRPSPPLLPPPQTTATRPGNRSSTTSATARAGALHQLLERALVRLLGAPGLVGGERAAGLTPSTTTATAAASSRECVIESSIRPAPIRSANARRAAAESCTPGFGRPRISISFQVK